MRKALLLLLALVGCSSDSTKTVDAAPPVDTAATAPLALDCNTYCTHLAADCTGTNAQISMANCMGTCAAFPLGTQADQSGNTLGCRNYHLQNIEVRNMPATLHCPHTGPVGGLIADPSMATVCGTSACDDWCAMQTKVCGTDAAPVTVAGTVITNRYTDLAACKAACTGFTKTPEANTTVQSGNNFACRIYHLTNAAAQTTAANVNAHCGHTLVSKTTAPDNSAIVGPCFQ